MDDNNIKTEIAVIKKDLENVDKLLSKMDLLVVEISNLSKAIALQNKTLENQENRIKAINEVIKDDRVEETTYRKEQSKKHDDLRDLTIGERQDRKESISEEIEKLNTRIYSLEKWKWWLMGMGAVIVSLLTFLSKVIL